MSHSLEASYAACRSLARSARSNFYGSFLLLPGAKRAAMCALYAFLRRADDIGDDPTARGAQGSEVRRQNLTALRDSLDAALNGRFDDPYFPALADTVERYAIPPAYLYAVLDGVEMDLVPRRYATFDDLAVYCRRVASVVGQACIHVWGFRGGEQALLAAEQCGIAFQLTNILRDLREDAAAGRVYLPLEDFVRFRYAPEELGRGVDDHRFQDLMRFEIARAEEFYYSGWRLMNWLEPEGRPIFGAMMTTYQGLLSEIKRRDMHVLHERIRLTAWHKWAIAARWLWFRARLKWLHPRS